LIDENGNRKQIKNTFRFRVEESNEWVINSNGR
jgi:hypothetical protein